MIERYSMHPCTRYDHPCSHPRKRKGFRQLFPILIAIMLACGTGFVHAGTNLTTTVLQPAGNDWTFAIWKTNGSTATNLVVPVAGNTYTMVSNGTPIGNNLSNTRVRNPTSGGLLTFPGDSLTMNTNT